MTAEVIDLSQRRKERELFKEIAEALKEMDVKFSVWGEYPRFPFDPPNPDNAA